MKTKTSAIACAVLASTFAFSNIAWAHDWRGEDRGHDRDQRFEQRHDGRFDRGDERRDHFRGDVRGQRPEYRPEYREPTYTYSVPAYRAQTHRYYRGGYVPYQFRGTAFYVNNWQDYQGLYAPAYGQQWVAIDGEFLLVAVATGLIVGTLLN